MKFKKSPPRKSKAQAMVEFAIALPFLLLLLYGLLEAGRLLFLYSTVVTASRQAVRYGSATGQGGDYTGLVPAGPDNRNYSRYQDCYGIRQAAQRVDFLNAFDDNDIVITYDNGPNTATESYSPCDGPADNGVKPSGANTTRIIVEIKGDFNPIVPNIVPFIARTAANGNPIRAISARTILVGVAIQVTAPPVTFNPSTPTNTATNTFTPSPTFTPSQTPTASNTPLVSPTASRTGTPTLPPTATIPPTITNTATVTPTAVPACATGAGGVTHGPITKIGNTLSMTIFNPYPYPLTTGDGTVTWNDDKGHQTGSDKTLRLQSITFGGTTVWTGNSNPGVATMPWTAPAVLPANSSVTITFSFHQSYDNFDGTEFIFFQVTTNGCNGIYVSSS